MRRVRTAQRELLAPRADVWAFLAEPFHLPDWWPGIAGVEPDRRGFASGARWKVRVVTSNLLLGRRERETTLLIRQIEPYERWAWHVLKGTLDVEVRLHARGDHTLVECTANTRRNIPELALKRLFDLVQTAATL